MRDSKTPTPLETEEGEDAPLSAEWKSLWIGFVMGLATGAAAILSETRQPWIEQVGSAGPPASGPLELFDGPTLRKPASLPARARADDREKR